MGEVVLNKENIGRSFSHENFPAASRFIVLGYCALFTALGAWQLTKGSINAFDSLLAAVLLAVVFYASKSFVLRPISAFLLGVVFIPNMIGQMGMYGSSMFNYHFDWVVHSVAAFCFTVVFIFFLLDNNMTKSFGRAALLALLVTVTLGAAIEAIEYWGFRAVGFGEGYLGFGDGDNSQNFGPWENSSLDTTNNFLGSILGILISLGIASVWRSPRQNFISSAQ